MSVIKTYIKNEINSNVLYYSLKLEFLQKKGGMKLLENSDLCKQRCACNFYDKGNTGYFHLYRISHSASSLQDVLLYKYAEELNKNPKYYRDGWGWCDCSDDNIMNCKCYPKIDDYKCEIEINDKMLDEINETLGGDIFTFQNLYYYTIYNAMRPQLRYELNEPELLRTKRQIQNSIENLSHKRILTETIDNLLSSVDAEKQKINPQRDLNCFDSGTLPPDVYNSVTEYDYKKLNKLTIHDFPIKKKYASTRVYDVDEYIKDKNGNNYFHIRLVVLQHFAGRLSGKLAKYPDICCKKPTCTNFKFSYDNNYEITCISHKDDIKIFKEIYKYYKCDEENMNIDKLIKLKNVTRDLIIVFNNILMEQIISIIPNIIEINNNDISIYPSNLKETNKYSISEYPIDDCP